jgi:hypothetical protein
MDRHRLIHGHREMDRHRLKHGHREIDRQTDTQTQ